MPGEHRTNKPSQVYHLYPGGPRGWTARSIAYHGTEYAIAAVSIQQAYYYAGNRVWADFEAGRPAGILEVYVRGRGHEMACGCVDESGLGLQHMASSARIRSAIDAHLENCPHLGVFIS